MTAPTPFIELAITLLGFRFTAAALMKTSVFWDTRMCRPVNASQRFGRLYLLDLQVDGGINQSYTGSKQAEVLVSCLA
jgi:hypothetical protein